MTTAVAIVQPAEFESEALPLWREALSVFDWTALHLSPVFYGLGVPKGNAKPVILIPGFLGNDTYLIELFLWLQRIGYQPSMSRMGRNAECPDLLTEKLLETVYAVVAQTGRKVALIGHSLGGTLARSVAARKPDLVDQVITLGSPIRSIRAHPLVLAIARIVKFRIDMGRYRQPSCFTRGCGCTFVQSLTEVSLPKTIDVVAVYTKTDGVVRWQSCVQEDSDRNMEVPGTHCGLAFNPATYKIIASELYRCL
ncbi:MAG: alpha/beta fold hydrolase [bacterium]|nr:alpha/beta fold hydrolase [bacterium]